MPSYADRISFAVIVRLEEPSAYPLHRPLSSNVPIRIFLSQRRGFPPGFFAAPSFFACSSRSAGRPCPSIIWRISSSLVSKGRLPMNNVCAAGCFCARRIFWAVLEWVFVGDWVVAGAFDSSSDVAAAALGTSGRPAKSSPVKCEDP